MRRTGSGLLVLDGLRLVGWGWSVVVRACGFWVGGLELVGRGLSVRVDALKGGIGAMLAHLGAMWAHLGLGLGWKVWGGWVGVGQCWSVLFGLGLVGRGLCLQVWHG